MIWLAFAADAVVVVHVLFIVFVVLGGLLVWRWPLLVVLHLPAACWGVLVEWMRWPCPLTPLEQHLRVAAGEAGYHGGFIEHYVLPILYPAVLTPQIQIALGLFVLILNLLVYSRLVLRLWRRQ